MPRRIPAKPDVPEGHYAEKKVWDALSEQLPDEAVLSHGQRFQERRQEYEADLIVAVPGAGWAGHVLGFKGLERPVVVLAVNGFRDLARAREMLCVGLSRARTQLVVCGDRTLIRQVGGEGVDRRLNPRG